MKISINGTDKGELREAQSSVSLKSANNKTLVVSIKNEEFEIGITNEFDDPDAPLTWFSVRHGHIVELTEVNKTNERIYFKSIIETAEKELEELQTHVATDEVLHAIRNKQNIITSYRALFP